MDYAYIQYITSFDDSFCQREKEKKMEPAQGRFVRDRETDVESGGWEREGDGWKEGETHRKRQIGFVCVKVWNGYCILSFLGVLILFS